MKRVIMLLFLLMGLVGISSYTSAQVRVLSLERSGALTFTNPLPVTQSNRVYGVQFMPTLGGDWQFDGSQAVAATKPILRLSVPITNRIGFFRVSRITMACGGQSVSNVLGFLAHENGERLAALNTTNGAFCYTSVSNQNAILYLGTNGLPNRIVDGNYIFLFGHYTSNTVDVATVWPGGAVTVARSIPVDPALLLQVKSLLSNPSPMVAAALGINRGLRPKDLSTDDWKELLEIGTLSLTIGGCAVMVVVSSPTVAGALAIGAACGSAIYETGQAAGWWGGNGIADMTDTAYGTFLCAGGERRRLSWHCRSDCPRKTYERRSRTIRGIQSDFTAYSDGCRTPIPIHIGQSFQFKADTCSD